MQRGGDIVRDILTRTKRLGVSLLLHRLYSLFALDLRLLFPTFVSQPAGEEFLRLSPHAKTEDISLYLAEFCLECVELGVSKLCIILDNNPTHKQKMRLELATHLQQMGLAQEITVEFLYVPPSSPKLNLVEYVIHLLRLRFLHHLPLGTTLLEIEQQLEPFLQSHQFLSSKQVRKTLNFIFSLVA